MQIGDQVKVLSGVDKGRVGRVQNILPGRHHGRWPYYIIVRLSKDKTIQAVVTRLQPYTPDQPLGNYWERPDPLGR
jgi:ribosomal protein L24